MKRVTSKSVMKKLMASALALTVCAPYMADSTYNIFSTLTAHAYYNGGGYGSGGGSGWGEWDGYDDMAIRLYVYDPTTGEIVKDASGHQLVRDIMQTNITSGNNSSTFGSIESSTVPGVKADTHIKGGLDTALTQIFTSSGSNLVVNGDKLKTWMLTERSDSYSYNVLWLIQKLFGPKEVAALTKDCYVVVEPMFSFNNGSTVIPLRAYLYASLGGNINNTYAYGPITASAGNGFQLTDDDLTPGINKTAPTASQYLTSSSNVSGLPDVGYGMHLYSLKDMPVGSNDPINTYDIESNPSTPSKPETPSTTDSSKTITIDDHDTELKNGGDINVIKVYMDAYVDRQASPNIPDGVSGDDLNGTYYNTAKKYTAVEQKAIYGEKSTTNEVVVQDEFDESGYHLVGWETSAYDWKVSGDKIVDNAGKQSSWNGEDWIKVTGAALQINDTAMANRAGTTSSRSRYNKLTAVASDPNKRNGVVYTVRNKLGTVDGADNVVNHKWDYTAKDGTIVGKYSGDETDGKPNDTQKVSLVKDTEKTIYVLYVREKPWVETNGDVDPPPTGSGSKTYTIDSRTITTRGTGDNSTTEEKNGGLNIVKVYGVIDGSDFHVSNIDTRASQNNSYNLDITPSEAYTYNGSVKNWRLHSYIFSDVDYSKASTYTASAWTDGDTNNQSLLNSALTKGYVDGYDFTKNNEVVVPESSRTTYKRSMWTKDQFKDKDNSNDTVFLLYLLDVTSKKTTGAVNIPESYLSKNFIMSEEQTVNKVVTHRKENENGTYSSIGDATSENLLSEHPFYFILPRLADTYTLVPETGVISRYSAENGTGKQMALVRFAKTTAEENSLWSSGSHGLYSGSNELYNPRGTDAERVSIPNTLIDKTMTSETADTFTGYDLIVGAQYEEFWSVLRSWDYRGGSVGYDPTSYKANRPITPDINGNLTTDLGIVLGDCHDRKIVSEGGKAVSLLGQVGASGELTDSQVRSTGRIIKLTGVDYDFTVYRDGDYANVAEWKFDMQNPYSAFNIDSQSGGSMYASCYNYSLNNVGSSKGIKIGTLADYINTLGSAPDTAGTKWNSTTVKSGTNSGAFINASGSDKTVQTKLGASNSYSAANRAANGNNTFGSIELYFTDKTEYGTGMWDVTLADDAKSPASVSLGSKTQFGTFGLYTVNAQWYNKNFPNSDFSDSELTKYFGYEPTGDEDADNATKAVLRAKYDYPSWDTSTQKKLFDGIANGTLTETYDVAVLMANIARRLGSDAVGIDISTKWFPSGDWSIWAYESGNPSMAFSESVLYEEGKTSFVTSYAKFLLDSGIDLEVPVTYDTYKGDYDSSNAVVARATAPDATSVRVSSEDGAVRAGEQIDKGTITFTPYIAMMAGTSQSERIIDTYEEEYNAATTDSAKKNTEKKLAHAVDKYIIPIIATQQRTLRVYDYAGIDYTVVKPVDNSSILGESTSTDKKITLSSSQWSTHARAAVIGKGNVLPGGATLALTTGKDAKTIVKAETWSAYLTGSGVNQVRSTNPGTVPELMSTDHVLNGSAILAGDDLPAAMNGNSASDTLTSLSETIKKSSGVSSEKALMTKDASIGLAMRMWSMPLVNQLSKSTCTPVIDEIVNRQKDYVKSLVVGLESINIDQYVAPVPEDKIERDSKNEENPKVITSVDESNIAPVWGMTNALKLNDTDESGYNNTNDKVSHRNIAGQEGKYYLRTDNSDYSSPQFLNDSFELKEDRANAGFGDLDTVTDNSMFTFYTFFTDTQGNIAVRYTNPMTEAEFYGNKGIANRAVCSMVNEISADEIKYCADNNVPESAHNRDHANVYVGDFSHTEKVDVETEIILRRDQTPADLTGQWKEVDKKIGIITNLHYALERGTGNDTQCPWALTDGKWYSEAFDGISYIQMTTDISTRFTNPYERNMILDPETTPGAEYGGSEGASENKGDLFTAINYSQFRTRAYTEAYGFDEAGKIAGNASEDKLRSKYDDYEAKVGSITVDTVDSAGNRITTDVSIKAPYLNELFVSDIFYIPNATVQDLK